MITKALQADGNGAVRMAEIDLPEIGSGELLMEVVANTVDAGDIAVAAAVRETNPRTVGRCFGGKIIGIGADYEGQYAVRQRIGIQLEDGELANPSYSALGGCSQYVVIPKEMILSGRVYTYPHDAFYYGALAGAAADALRCGSGLSTGNDGGRMPAELQAAVQIAAAGRLEPGLFVSCVGGIDAELEVFRDGAAPQTGGRMLFYSHLSMPLVKLSEPGSREEPFYRELAAICGKYGGAWSAEAEQYLLLNAARI